MVGENFDIYGVQMINQKIQTKKNKFRHLRHFVKNYKESDKIFPEVLIITS